jgi:hypothetical protein
LHLEDIVGGQQENRQNRSAMDTPPTLQSTHTLHNVQSWLTLVHKTSKAPHQRPAAVGVQLEQRKHTPKYQYCRPEQALDSIGTCVFVFTFSWLNNENTPTSTNSIAQKKRSLTVALGNHAIEMNVLSECVN